MPETSDERNYKNTLNLPKTAFNMKANLVQNEPASLKRWDKSKLYAKVREARKDAKPFYFHDGPPYANGSIHLGHLLNKALKDFVVRSHTMMDRDVPYVPGWDCHGLPIEHKVMQAAEPASAGVTTNEERMKVRRACRKYAEKYVKLQTQQMQRLLTLADYDEPYLTMNPKYEAAVLEVFADMVEKGVVYRGLKPVHWSIENQTALAEAELEYYDRQDTSVYVKLLLDDLESIPEIAREKTGGAPVELMIWTTTPWTLPANLAVAVAPSAEYGFFPIREGTVAGFVILAVDLAPTVFKKEGKEVPKPVAVCRGEELVGLTYNHPFIDKSPIGKSGTVWSVTTADYVTLEDGTGLVHTAPGHGVEDYQTGLREGLDIYCPVQADGTFDDTAPDWLQGIDVWKANDLVVEHLRESGHLFHAEKFTHSYPHDWRGKTPTIFRATEQWFVGVDQMIEAYGMTLRELALEKTTDTKFVPEWGRNRMRGMLQSRPDWCISRQRSWGLPIPAFYPPPLPDGTEDKSEPLLTPASIRAVAKLIGEKGSDVWFLAPARDLLQHYDAESDPNAPDWIKSEIRNPKSEIRISQDIFDVWFESGSSWNAVMKQRFGEDAVPTDLYLEGSDQHRGWFQLSLLPALVATGLPPFRGVLTHGFMVDKDGKKMSKSLGNALEVDELLKNYGADVCRWWVSGLNTDNDIKVDESYFKLAGEEYRKVRNTIRFLLSNLGDFSPRQHNYVFTDADATSLDDWVLDELMELVDEVYRGYERFAYQAVHKALFNFCNETLSAVYLAAVKDRLYCDAPGSLRRRRTQSAIWRLADALIRMLAPIMPHTADEAWHALHGDEAESVHLQLMPEPKEVVTDPDWATVIEQRDDWLRAIEAARQKHAIDNPLDCGVVAPGSDTLAKFDPVDLADLCGVSRFSLGDTLTVVDLRDQPRCQRSWKRDGTVKQRSDGGWLSDRDAVALGLA